MFKDERRFSSYIRLYSVMGLRMEIMPCDVFKKLESEHKRASPQYAQFTFEENRGIRGVSKTKAKQLARDATSRMRTLEQQINGHQQNCETCKLTDTVPNPRSVELS